MNDYIWIRWLIAVLPSALSAKFGNIVAKMGGVPTNPLTKEEKQAIGSVLPDHALALNVVNSSSIKTIEIGIIAFAIMSVVGITDAPTPMKLMSSVGALSRSFNSPAVYERVYDLSLTAMHPELKNMHYALKHRDLAGAIRAYTKLDAYLKSEALKIMGEDRLDKDKDKVDINPAVSMGDLPSITALREATLQWWEVISPVPNWLIKLDYDSLMNLIKLHDKSSPTIGAMSPFVMTPIPLTAAANNIDDTMGAASNVGWSKLLGYLPQFILGWATRTGTGGWTKDEQLTSCTYLDVSYLTTPKQDVAYSTAKITRPGLTPEAIANALSPRVVEDFLTRGQNYVAILMFNGYRDLKHPAKNREAIWNVASYLHSQLQNMDDVAAAGGVLEWWMTNTSDSLEEIAEKGDINDMADDFYAMKLDQPKLESEQGGWFKKIGKLLNSKVAKNLVSMASNIPIYGPVIKTVYGVAKGLTKPMVAKEAAKEATKPEPSSAHIRAKRVVAERIVPKAPKIEQKTNARQILEKYDSTEPVNEEEFEDEAFDSDFDEEWDESEE